MAENEQSQQGQTPEYVGMPVEFEEGQRLLKNHICAVCSNILTLVWGGAFKHEGYLLRCGGDGSHRGIVKETSPTQAYRQGQAVPITVANKVDEKALLPSGVTIQTALAMLKVRFPAADLLDPSAALFLYDCYRLGLDPFLGEVVPATFTSGKTGRKIVQMIITEQGWSSLAARGDPDRWVGSPATEPIIEPEIKEAICGDAHAWVWRAWGKVRLPDGQIVETEATYGWFKQKEYQQAQQKGLPAAEHPSNQARVRAVKRWIWLNFADAKKRVQQLTQDWLKRPDAQEMRTIIEAEYRVVEEGQKKTEEQKPAAAALSPGHEGLASQPQRNYLLKLGHDKFNWDVRQTIGELEKLGTPLNALTVAQASKLIDTWKQKPDFKQEGKLV